MVRIQFNFYDRRRRQPSTAACFTTAVMRPHKLETFFRARDVEPTVLLAQTTGRDRGSMWQVWLQRQDQLHRQRRDKVDLLRVKK